MKSYSLALAVIALLLAQSVSLAAGPPRRANRGRAFRAPRTARVVRNVRVNRVRAVHAVGFVRQRVLHNNVLAVRAFAVQSHAVQVVAPVQAVAVAAPVALAAPVAVQTYGAVGAAGDVGYDGCAGAVGAVAVPSYGAYAVGSGYSGAASAVFVRRRAFAVRGVGVGHGVFGLRRIFGH